MFVRNPGPKELPTRFWLTVLGINSLGHSLSGKAVHVLIFIYQLEINAYFASTMTPALSSGGVGAGYLITLPLF